MKNKKGKLCKVGLIEGKVEGHKKLFLLFVQGSNPSLKSDPPKA
jgi:hypothetical protein